MIDIILLFAICLIFIVGPVSTVIWKKRYFVKEIYYDKGVAIILYAIIIGVTVGSIIIYYLTPTEEPFGWIYLLIIFLFDLLYVLICCYISTKNIFISDDKLIDKSIYRTKKVVLNTKLIIKETYDKISISDGKKVVTISYRHLSGNIKSIISRVKNNSFYEM